ncbi:MAG: ABC transporter ATP-binding protein/permease [Bacteroidales bacterium]|nr:ABC transporter ATP-binding protein/permease [Bacteroidales bacterium]
MKEFWKILRRYVSPYGKYLWGSVAMNLLSAILNIFSFSLIVPMLDILFRINRKVYEFIPLDSVSGLMEKGNAIANNCNWWLAEYIKVHGESRTLLMLVIFLCVMTLFKTACYFGSAAVMVPIRTGVVKDLRMQIYDKILALPLGYFSQERKGDLIARMSGDVNEIEYSIISVLEMLIKNPILIVCYFAALMVISWELTLFTILVVPFLGWVMGSIGRTLKKKSLAAQELWSDTMSQVEETLGGLRVIKAFIAEATMGRRFDKITEALRNKTGRVSTRQALAHPVSEFLGTVLIGIVLWFGGTLIIRESAPLSASSFIYYLVILYSILNPLKDFSKAGYSIPKGMASMERIDKILLAENSIKEAQDPKEISSFEKGIEFDHVSFRYEEGGKTILNDVCVEVSKGSNIAIVGESGAGKSTLADLIPRFYDVTEGAIRIDGIDIRDLSMKSLRGLIGYVNQEPILFNDTIFNNIAFGVKDATMEQVIEAAKIANAHEFIMEKEDGYNTNIGDRGMRLSGGQRQRLSIARAILKNPPILILDEATASLDTESERLVQEALDRLMSTRTTIAIAHRLSTIKNSDQILVMQEGRIVEHGKHKELVELGGYYKKLEDMQSL